MSRSVFTSAPRPLAVLPVKNKVDAKALGMHTLKCQKARRNPGTPKYNRERPAYGERLWQGLTHRTIC